MLEKFDQWLEAPQIVLDGMETLIFAIMLLIAGIIWFKSGRKGE
jgi:hypothetical protein